MEEEIKAGTELKDKKTQELADTDEKLAMDKQDIEDTRNSLSADQKFLMNLKETCQNADAEYEERVKSRQEEIKACGEALAILTSDEAHATFSGTFSFAQTSATSKSQKAARDSASKVLSEAAKTLHSPRLSALASRVRLDAFTKVKAAIDEMIEALLKEKKDEIKHKDFCTDALNTNEREAELKQRDIDEVTAKIQDLTTQLKRAGEDREKENADFQTTVAEQRASQQILTKALDVLKAVYAKKEFMQIRAKQEPAGPPPPPGFKKYEKSGGSGGVMGMIEQIIADA